MLKERTAAEVTKRKAELRASLHSAGDYRDSDWVDSIDLELHGPDEPLWEGTIWSHDLRRNVLCRVTDEGYVYWEDGGLWRRLHAEYADDAGFVAVVLTFVVVSLGEKVT